MIPEVSAELLAHATPEELAALEASLRAELALESPADYAEAVSKGQFLRPPHIDLINRTLAALVEGRLLKPHLAQCSAETGCPGAPACHGGSPYRKLAVSMPPRNGKSWLISRYTPAWLLAKYPERKVAVTSYEADFAASWGRQARDVLLEAPPGLAPPLRKDTTAASRWDTTAGGGMFTSGVGGPLTGKGFHLLVVDDPIKNFEDSRSDTKREAAHNWFLSTALTRLEPGGVVVLVQTRWHGDDLAGRMLRDEPEEWYQLVLPALAGENDPLGRLPGEALWPERYDEKTLGALRESLGPQIFASLYQQTPYIEGGGIFRIEKARYYTKHTSERGDYVLLHAPAGEKAVSETQLGKFMTVDLAASTKSTADYSVYALWGVTPDSDDRNGGNNTLYGGSDGRALLLLDVFRARIEGADHMSTLERLYQEWKPRFVGIERATYGLTLLQTASRTGRIPVRELKPDFDKVSRAFAAAALLEAGRLYFPKSPPWVEDWLAELAAFPQGRHDDMVDSTSYAALVLSERLHAPRPQRPGDGGTYDERVWGRFSKNKKRPVHPILGAW